MFKYESMWYMLEWDDHDDDDDDDDEDDNDGDRLTTG